MPFYTAGIMKFMLNTKIVMEELGIIQQVSKELFRLSIVAMVKQTVITAAINMRPICGKPHVLHVREVG